MRRITIGLSLLLGSAAAGYALGATQDAASAGPPRYQPVVVVQLAVEDLDRAVAFYTETLGLELDSRIDALRWAKVKTAVPGLYIGLGESEEAAGSGTASLNLGVGDAAATRAFLEGAGVEFPGEATVIPGVVHLEDCADPDGNRIRIAGPAN